jgi:hypothetical protein
MKLLSSSESKSRGAIACVTCATYRRPRDVPWNQHAIGCAIRVAATELVGHHPR